MNDVGLVAIGRNEGGRLRRCLISARNLGIVLVYVDSGSSDGSVEVAGGLGAEIVDLDLSTPFTAARARNEGLGRLREIAPDVRYVQFIDGDCELADGWIDRGRRELGDQQDLAVVCGRLRERHPEQSVYNRLADLEWDTPVGDVPTCGGIAMMRIQAIVRVGGFDASLIAGEEPELCLRLRRDGWKVKRVASDMAYHDMAMTQFRQWWRRAVRAGHAFAEGAALHGAGPERHFVRETRSAVVWGGAMPILALTVAWPTRGLSLAALAAAYALLFTRVWLRARKRPGWRLADATAYATFIVLGKPAGAIGVVRYWLGRFSGRRSRVIDHRGAASELARAETTPPPR